MQSSDAEQCLATEPIFAAQGSKSQFRAFLQTLPQKHDCVLCWTKGQLSELQGKLAYGIFCGPCMFKQDCKAPLSLDLSTRMHARMHRPAAYADTPSHRISQCAGAGALSTFGMLVWKLESDMSDIFGHPACQASKFVQELRLR